MSTWLYLKCLDHDPPLVAEDESGQHLSDLPRIRQEVADREALLKEWEGRNCVPGYFTYHSLRFLAQHRKCRIGIEDEYGEDHKLTDDTEATK